jgi:hypothetical protein
MSLAQDEIVRTSGGLMSGMMGYAQPLRAIGQALETLNLTSFELEPAGEDFYVKGIVAASHPELSEDRLSLEKLSAVWGQLSETERADRDLGETKAAPVLTPIELQYTMKDVDRLEQEGQAKRSDPHRVPDTSRLSQVLRCVGAYLNQKPARLVKIARNAEAVSVEYETSLGSIHKETLAVSEVYDLWVRMYMQRAERESH